MTATDELRAMLNERGVEWEAWNDCITAVPPSTHYLEVSNGALCVAVVDATPEQAIAATLGQAERTCHDTSTNPLRFKCSECGGVSLEIVPQFCPCCGAKAVDA